MDVVRVVGAAVVSARGLLLVSKRAAPGRITEAVPLMRVCAPAALEPVPLDMHVFLTRLHGIPAAAAEICELAWWPAATHFAVAPAARDVVIPRLQDHGVLGGRGDAGRR